MKCPKCHYLSFDPEPRCRNCGYTLALDEDLPITPTIDSPDLPLADLELRGATAPSDATMHLDNRAVRPVPPSSTDLQSDRWSPAGPFDEAAPSDFFSEQSPALRSRKAPPEAVPADRVTPPPSEASPRRSPAASTSELPLFVKGMASEDVETVVPEAPAVTRVSRPLSEPPPVAPAPPSPVRRRTEKSVERPTRETQGSRLGPLDRDLLEGLQRIEHVEQTKAAEAALRARLENSAGAAKRASGAAVDAALLAGLSLVIAWITLRWCDMSWTQLSSLPLIPLSAFLLLIVVGYLCMFTAATGQTIGKMVAGTRVVDAGASGVEQHRAGVRQVMYRELMAVPAVLAFGAGFLPALRGDERALHDRIAQTRVVRA